MISSTLVALEIAGDLTVLLQLAGPADDVTLVVRPAEAVSAFRLWNDLPVTGIADGVIVEVGAVAQPRQILLGFEIPAELALADVCEFELRWVDGTTESSATLAVQAHTNGEFSRAARMPTVDSS